MVIAAALGGLYFTVPDSPLRTVAWVLSAVAPIVAIGIGVRRHKPASVLPWALLGLAQVTFATGDALNYWRTLALGEDTILPSVADLCYLLMYPCLTAAVTIFVRRRNPHGDRPALLDASIIGLGLTLLAWVFIIGPTLGSELLDVPTRLAAVVYPLGDVLVISVLARLWSDRGPHGPALALLTSAFGALLVSDILYASLRLNDINTVGTALDVGWQIYYLCLGAAALHPSMAQLDTPVAAGPTRISGARFAMLLAVSSLLVPIVVAVHSAVPKDLPLLLVVAVALFSLVLVRMIGLVEALRVSQHRASEGRFLRLTEQVTDVLTICDRHAVIRYQSPSVERLLGVRQTEMVGRSLVELLHPDDTGRVTALLATTPVSGQLGPVECRVRRADGRYVVTETIGRAVDDDDLRGYLLTTRDVTERKELEEQLTHRAFHDELTGLANRALLADRVQHALERRGAPYKHLAVLVVDLDDFKTVNDSLGRAVGDQLLKSVADRLRGCLRSADTAARLVGDEFAMLLEHLDDPAEAARIAERVLAAMRQPLLLDGREIVPWVSVGIALADPDRLPDADELLRNADVAMHMAKRQGRNRFAWFAPSMHAGLMQKLDLAADLRAALERRELLVYYQPLVALADGRILGAEALVRWPHPEHGFIPPDRFIPLAEETGLVLPLGYEVLNTACKQAAAWQRDGAPLRVSVNLSPRQVQDPGLVLYVRQALARSGLPAEALTLEITESLLSEDAEVASHRLRELKDLGVRLAVDDFGTGYSSLSRLHEFPIDILKIPKPFVDGVARGTEQSALARAIVDLSSALGLQVIAEGIEEGAQSIELRRLGCEIGQGYHFARPVPAAEFDALLARGFTKADAPTPG